MNARLGDINIQYLQGTWENSEFEIPPVITFAKTPD